MRPALALSLLVSAASVAAQYVSSGWQPGQTPRVVRMRDTGYDPANPYRPNPAPPADAQTDQQQQQQPVQETPKHSKATGGFWVQLFSSGPLADFAQKVGVNVSRVVERQHIDDAWDRRIPLIYDEDFNETVVHEVMTREEEEDRVWALVISGGPQSTPTSKWVDQQFDEAFNISQIAGDLKHVRWGRINYNDVTYLTTKWAVWKAPVLVLATNRGQTLRFFYPARLNMRAEMLHKLLVEDAWQDFAPWSSLWAPGGEREWLMDKFAKLMTWQYRIITQTPRIILLLLTGGITSFLVQFLHRGGGKQEVKTKRVLIPGQAKPADAPAIAPVAEATAANASSSKDTTKKRKTRK
ncbi:hypothetical protein BKA62DRAFT_690379 [Auriculariales sp. MPI-PUGE-AT-0066]|nr:hypothetical protein BKA62DRAFT_690379 [Auriculariales sp. MPI-PUGE-AT-0066]